MKSKVTNENTELSNFIYEAAAVKRLKRTGWQILGDNEEELGGHCFMTAVISYVLAKRMGATLEKVLTMAIFHDFHEARTGDVDKLATFYITRETVKANKDIFQNSMPELFILLEEYEKRESLEANIVYEANVIALLVELKLLVERGNTLAGEWLSGNKIRIKLKESRELVDSLLVSDSQQWWKKFREELRESFLA